MEPGTPWIIAGIVIATIGSAIGGIVGFYGKQVNSTYRSKLSNAEVTKGVIAGVRNEFRAILTDKQDKELVGFTGVQLLDDKIVDTNKGYLRIKLEKSYLNSSFAVPVTLKNSDDEYQPITVLCDNDPKRGPGIIAILPSRKARTVFYLTDFLRFENFGKLNYVEDFVFELFYNDVAFYVITTSGAIKVDPLPNGTNIVNPIQIGPNLITRPFDETGYGAAQKMFPGLATYFGRDFSKVFPGLYRG